MSGILLTQNSTFIIGPVAKLLGYIMEGIFWALDKVGIPNVGLSIILFTIVIYLLMMPLTVKQQKFSKLSARMNPELQAIQSKYKGKKDNESMMAMNQETQAVYAKYGVSPSGSCLQLLIQMPILFALYRVIYAMPAYVGKIKDAFFPLVDKLITVDINAEFIKSFNAAAQFTKQFANSSFIAGETTDYVRNTYVDVLNKLSSAEWTSIAETFPNLSADVSDTVGLLNKYNYFFGLNMADSPAFAVSKAMDAGSWLLVIGALLIPVLSGLTQWINVKLMPQPETNNSNNSDQQNTMAQSMKMMNMTMPIMSIIFCFTLPSGMGLYWIAGAVVRTIQQIIINKHIDKIDMDEMIKNNIEKRNKKLEKAGMDPQKLNNYATMSTRNVNPSKTASNKPSLTQEEREAAMKKATDYYNNNAKPGSIAAKANMVKKYNENNNK